MIFSIIYYVLLIIFTKLNTFRELRKKLKPNQIIALYLFTGCLFLFDCFNIYTNPYYISKNMTYDKTARKYVLIVYISLFWSITLFLFSHYQRKQFRYIKPSMGLKGPRGLKGSIGNNAKDKCDKRACKEEIIFNKVLKAINETYTELNQRPSFIKNNYIKNKVKLIIDSEQYKEYEDRVGFDTTLQEVINKWRECIHFILEHSHGESFLENEGMDDNDFDYLLKEDDYSPFDKIKHFDMWYWGEPKSSQIKVQYRCDIPNKDLTIKVLDSNQYDLLWRSSIAKQTKVDNTYKPYQNKGNKKITVYRPKILTTEKGVFYPTGDLIVEGDINENNKTELGDVEPPSERDPNKNLPGIADPLEKVQLITGDFVHPDEFKLMYSGRAPPGSVGEGTDAYSFWKPISKSKYHTCIGTMVNTNIYQQPPSKENYACPPKKCLSNIKETKIWESTKDKNDINVDNAYKEVNYEMKKKDFIYNEKCLNKGSIDSKGDWKYLPKYNDKKYSITAQLLS